VRGELGAILRIADAARSSSKDNAEMRQIKVVAGTRFSAACAETGLMRTRCVDPARRCL
jgi:hypothetical protein